jgi:hypothetical protein
MLHLNTIDETTHQTLLSFHSKEYLKGFSLAGGTNLSLRFGHRKSIDLDMFSTSIFSTSDVNDLLQTDYDYRYRSNNRYMLFSYVNNVKVDWIHHPFPLLAPLEVIEGIRFFSVADISAMKLFAVTKRGSKKGFFDIHKLCEALGPDTIIKHFAEKYGDDKTWMMKMSLIYFEDADKDEDPEILEKKVTWSKVKDYMLKTFSPR